MAPPWTSAEAASDNVSKKQLIAYLQENAGSHFDPEVVAAFLGRWEQVQTFLALGRDGAPVPDAA